MSPPFALVAEIRTARRREVAPRLLELVPGAEVEETETGFDVRAQVEGDNARDLNRILLSALRDIEKRTTMRSEWTSGKTMERFLDYLPKGIHKV